METVISASQLHAMRKKRIAFLSDAVAPFHKGGKETRLYEIARRLARNGNDVHIYTMKWWDGPNIITLEGMHFHALCKLYPLYINDRRSIVEAVMFSIASFKLVFEEFDVLDADHIPFYPLFSARIVTWIKRKKLFATWHEVWGGAYWREYLGGFKGVIGAVTERISFVLPDVIVANSVHTQRRLMELGIKKRIETVPLGTDLSFIKNAAASHRASDLICVGRLLNHKNVDMLIECVALLKENKPDISCMIIGRGPEEERLRQKIAELKLESNVTLDCGVETQDELYGYMKASKVLVLPSIREGFGIVVVEANAAGLPAITTTHENNAAKELIHEGINGYLAEPKAEHFAEKILHTLNSREALTPSRFVEEYDWDRVAERVNAILV